MALLQAAFASSPSVGIGRFSKTASTRPNSCASAADMNLSRSIARSISSIGLLVYSA